MIVENGQIDVTTYFVLRDGTTHAPKTDVAVTDIDLYYVEEGSAISAKIDCTALVAANSLHSDGKAFHCGQGLYRIDWPDTAFNGGAGKRVNLIVVCSGVDTEFREILLSPNVNVTQIEHVDAETVLINYAMEAVQRRIEHGRMRLNEEN